MPLPLIPLAIGLAKGATLVAHGAGAGWILSGVGGFMTGTYVSASSVAIFSGGSAVAAVGSFVGARALLAPAAVIAPTAPLLAPVLIGLTCVATAAHGVYIYRQVSAHKAWTCAQNEQTVNALNLLAEEHV